MEQIERRAESILAELPDYIWDGDPPPSPVEEIADASVVLTFVDGERVFDAERPA